MSIEGWNYYQHAAIPAVYPHENPDLTPVENGAIWKMKGVLFARWTSDFDCGYETAFWACIADKPLDISELKAKRRYEINKGNKNFYTRALDVVEIDAMYDVYVDSLAGYAGNKQPISKELFCSGWREAIGEPGVAIIGAFRKIDDTLCGFAHCIDHGLYIPVSTFKTCVTEEKNNVNFALMYGIFEFYKDKLANGSYLCDGWRNILHETAFQDWLEKYFQFRKAYCILHIKYKGIIGIAIAILYPFRGLLSKSKKISAVFNMEKWSRQCKASAKASGAV